MFGYVRAYKPELKCREYDIYKGIYCSLCKELGRRYSPLAQMALTYDGTFLALMGLALEERCVSLSGKRCTYNPLKRCDCCEKNNSSVCFAADATVILFYYKLLDNISDKGFLKKLAACLLFPAFSLMRKKAARLCPEVDLIASRVIEKQKIAEADSSAGIDAAAEPSAAALGEIMQLYARNDNEKIVLQRLGYLIGRWVYIIDAADDLPDDIKKGGFNPIKKRFSEFRAENEDFKNDYISYVTNALQMTAGEAAKAFELLDMNGFRPIAENIIYDGLRNSMLFVLRRRTGQNEKKSV